MHVAVIKGESRYENIMNALKLIEKDVKALFKHKSRIVITPNCVSPTNQLASTHVDALKAVVLFIRRFYNNKLIIAEGSAYSTKDAFKHFNYYLLKDYDVDFVDLNEDEFKEIEVYDKNLNPMKVGVAKTMLNADLRISVAPMKTHDTVIVTLSLKNCIVGSLIKRYVLPRFRAKSIRKILESTASLIYRNDKTKIHQGYKAINKSLFKLAKHLYPHLSIIDAFQAMEGDGPIDGERVEMKLAIAGTDFLSVDTVASYIMGFDISQIGYLWYCKQNNMGEGNINKIKILGNVDIRKERKSFKPHKTYEDQLKWKVSSSMS